MEESMFHFVKKHPFPFFAGTVFLTLIVVGVLTSL